MSAPTLVTWGLIAAAIAALLVRPFRWPEFVWPLAAALALCLGGLLPVYEALHAVWRGADVYFFLTGMMIASELARQEGVFDYLAKWAAWHADGSARRLFLLVYGVGTLITMFMSNDATAVVLTPAVLAVTRVAKVKNPLPYLYACAFVANAASFVLPISNPANLVIFQQHMPSLGAWLLRFGLPSLASIFATFAALRYAERAALRDPLPAAGERSSLSDTGKWTAAGLLFMAAVMLGASACGLSLGWPTLAAGAVLLAAVCLRKRVSPVDCLKQVSWGVIPLVAGLFVLVQAAEGTGAVTVVVGWLQQASQGSAGTAWAAGMATALASNLANNLPVGLLAGSVVAAAHPPHAVSGAVLIGVDLGPNLSVTGSLATLLWLGALRREDVHVDAWRFLKLGAVVMLPALILSLAVLAI